MAILLQRNPCRKSKTIHERKMKFNRQHSTESSQIVFQFIFYQRSECEQGEFSRAFEFFFTQRQFKGLKCFRKLANFYVKKQLNIAKIFLELQIIL